MFIGFMTKQLIQKLHTDGDISDSEVMHFVMTFESSIHIPFDVLRHAKLKKERDPWSTLFIFSHIYKLSEPREIVARGVYLVSIAKRR